MTWKDRFTVYEGFNYEGNNGYGIRRYYWFIADKLNYNIPVYVDGFGVYYHSDYGDAVKQAEELFKAEQKFIEKSLLGKSDES